jgi:hypothetical protein
MRLPTMFLAFLLSMIAAGNGTARALPAPANSCCDIAAQALRDASAIRPGMTRAQVERTFELSGGVSFGNQIAYVYRKCHLLRLTIVFTMNANHEMLSTDRVQSVSKLSVESEPKD